MLLRTVETLIVAALGGILFHLIGFPAGLVSGSVLAVALAALAGRPMIVPTPIARVTFVLVGISLGAVVTPETLKGIMVWPLSVAALAIATGCMIVATTAYLRFVHGWDALSALLGASPGGLAQVMALSAEYGADLRAVAVVQTIRVVLLTVGLPAALALFGLAGSGAPAAQAPVGSLMELAILIVVSTLTAFATLWFHLPGGLLFGAMIGSGVLHGAGIIDAVLPWWATSAGVVGLGATAGARFTNTSPRVLMSYIGAAFGSFAIAAAIAACFALMVASMFSIRIADLVVAFSPGAQDTMMVLALALHLDPVFVGAHHVARFLVVSLAVPILARRIAPPALPPGKQDVDGRENPRSNSGDDARSDKQDGA
jgi:membrane AbrB-like protein